MVGPAPDLRPAAEVYWVRLVTLPRGRVEATVDLVFGWLDRIMPPGLNVDSHGGFDPTTSGDPESRYRIVVGRHDTDASVGVDMPRGKKDAQRALEEVEHLLATSTAAEFVGLYELASLE
jgi:hypothetical protein